MVKRRKSFAKTTLLFRGVGSKGIRRGERLAWVKEKLSPSLISGALAHLAFCN
jgi:hypothetical protein